MMSRALILPLSVLALLLTFGFAGVGGTTPAARAAPQPDMTSDAWRLDFQYQSPTPIASRGPSGALKWYWYLPYTVTNHTGERRLFVPEATVATSTGRVFSAGDHVPDSVFEKVSRQLNNPLLKSPLQVAGPLLVGEDHAKQSVFIWPANPPMSAAATQPAGPADQNIDSFRLFISGLSGETATMTHPVTGKTIQLQRSLMLEYRTPGSYRNPQQQPVNFVGEQWVMR